MPSRFHQIKKQCDECGQLLRLNNNRDIDRKRFCSRECLGLWTVQNRDNGMILKKMHSKAYTSEANEKKSHKGENHPRWIKDRTQLKAKRFFKEERDFVKEVLKEKNYICDITKEQDRELSVHHLYGVRDRPELRFDKDNVVVIKRSFHKLFHTIYGWGRWEKIVPQMYSEFKQKYVTIS